LISRFAARRGLVDGDPGHAECIGAGARLLHVMVDDAPQSGVVLLDNARHRLGQRGGNPDTARLMP
jgi:hypothetical protein